MEKQLIMTTNVGASKRMVMMMKRLSETLVMPMNCLRRYYAIVLEREITMKQAWVMTEAQLAFFATVLPADYHIVLRIAACLWFVATLKRCRSLV